MSGFRAQQEMVRRNLEVSEKNVAEDTTRRRQNDDSGGQNDENLMRRSLRKPKEQLGSIAFHKDMVIHNRDDTIHDDSIGTQPEHKELDQSESHNEEYHDNDSFQEHWNSNIGDDEYVDKDKTVENQTENEQIPEEDLRDPESTPISGSANRSVHIDDIRDVEEFKLNCGYPKWITDSKTKVNI